MKINKTEPPKDREFLAYTLNSYSGEEQWEFYKWKGVYGFEDRDECSMPDIVGWIEVPEAPELEVE